VSHPKTGELQLIALNATCCNTNRCKWISCELSWAPKSCDSGYVLGFAFALVEFL